MTDDETARVSRRLISTEHLAECFWPDVTHDELAALDGRVRESAVLTEGGPAPVRYLGTMLVPSDEVVFCFFEGSLDAVRGVATRAGVPFERIVETVRVSSVPPFGGDSPATKDAFTGHGEKQGSR